MTASRQNWREMECKYIWTA